MKRDSPESETFESSQSVSPAFFSHELPASKQHTRKLVGVGERIIGPEQALELIKLTVFTTGGAFNPQPKVELR